MLLVLAHVSVKEDCETEFLHAFASYHEKITAGEPGTTSFDLYRDQEQDHAYTIVEKYHDQAAYKAHVESPWRDEALGLIRATLSNGRASQHDIVDLSQI